MENNPKKDNSLLAGCAGITIVAIVFIVIAVVFTLVVKGEKGAHEIANDDTIGILRGGLILLGIIGIIYLVSQYKK